MRLISNRMPNRTFRPEKAGERDPAESAAVNADREKVPKNLLPRSESP